MFNLKKAEVRYGLLVVACVVMAITLRLFYLDSQSLWYDEGLTVKFASQLLPIRDVHPPTYFLIVHLMTLLGRSEFWLRLPSVVMGVADVILMFYVGRLMFSNRVALIATFLGSISPMLVWHSQDARMYTQLVLGCLITLYFYLQINRRGKTIDWIGYTAGALFSVYTQLYAVVFVAVLSLHFLIFHRDRLLRWIGYNLILVMGYVPWLLVLTTLPRLSERMGTSRPFSVFTPIYSFFVFSNGYSLGPSILELRDFSLSVIAPYLPLLLAVGIVVAALLIAGARSAWSTNREICALLLFVAFLPCLLATVIPLVVPSMTYNVRYVLFSLPAFLYLLANGVVAWKRQALGFILLAILALYNVGSLYNYYFDGRYSKEDIRSAAEFVAKNATPDDHVLVITVDDLFKWYFHGTNLVLDTSSSLSADGVVDQAADGTRILWLVESRPWQTDPSNEIKKLLDSRYSLIDKIDFSGVTLYHYCIADCSPT